MERPVFGEEWLVAVLDSLDEGVIALSRTGHVVAANPSAERLLEFSIAEMRNRHVTELALRAVDEHGTPLPPERDPVLRTIDTRLPVRRQVIGTAGSPPRWLEITTQILSDTRGRAGGDIVVSFTDVTARVQADAARRDFVAMASHELRTPIVALLGFGDLLADDTHPATDDERRDWLEAMRRQGRHLLRLVDDLLVASQLDTGRLTVRSARTGVRQLIDEALAGLPGSTEVGVSVPDDLLTLVDPDHGRRVFVNLIENALKYGAPPVRIDAAVAAGGVEIAVTDAGPGVPTEFVPRLFEKFSQASGGAARTASGTGLGLAIVEGLVGLNGGAIRYEPNVPRGARFVVRLPAG